MKTKYFSALVIMFLLFNAVNLDVFSALKAPAPAPKPVPAPKTAPPKTTPAPKPYNPAQPRPKSPGSTGGTTNPATGVAADGPEVLEPSWQADSFSVAVNLATHDKKVVFVYFYFNEEKDKFPANYDEKFKAISEEKYIFAKILVATEKDKNGRVVISDENASFFKDHKLAPSCIGVALDPYGNLMGKLPPPMSGPKIIPFMDSADKKYNQILNDLNNRYERADNALLDIDATPDKDKPTRKLKLMPEVIKTLQSVVNSDYEGYQAIEKSNAKLAVINKNGRAEYLKLMKEYSLLDKELRDPKSVVPEMEKLVKIYKGLPVEQEVKDAMKDVKDGKVPENVIKELEKPVAPPVSTDEPKDGPQDPPKDENPEEHQGQDKE